MSEDPGSRRRPSKADKFLDLRTRVFHDVMIEAARASRQYGDENLEGCRPDLADITDRIRAEVDAAMEQGTQTWSAIISEEHFEVLTEQDPIKRRGELIQLAAVAVRWAEAIDRRAAMPAEELLKQEREWMRRAAHKAAPDVPDMPA